MSLLVSLPTGETFGQSMRSGDGRAAADATFSVRWEHLPLADAVERLQEISRSEVLLDRRVDPDQWVTLTLTNATAEQVAAQLAAACNLSDAKLGRLIYFGPEQSADGLAALAATRRKEVAGLPADTRRSLTEQRKIVWPRLTEPRGLVTRLVADHGWRVAAADQIPHDLWAAGELPNLPLTDQLTLLLVGFDLSYQVRPAERTIKIVPIDWSTIDPAASPRTSRKRTPQPSAGKQVFSLRIESQPVGKVLEQLAQRLGWQIAVDELALSRAGRSLDTRVSFNVENADEDQLLESLLTPAGLTAERVGQNVRIAPR